MENIGAGEEVLKENRPDIVFLPTINDFAVSEAAPFTALAWEDFSPERYRQNITTLQELAASKSGLDLSEEEKRRLGELQKYIAGAERYNGMVDQFPNAQPIRDTLKQRLPQLDVQEGEVDLEEFRQRVKQKLLEEKGNLVLCSDSHHTTLPELTTVKEIVPDAKIGLVVFDRHIDLYMQMHENDPQTVDKHIDNSIEGKAVFLLNLLRDKTIEGVAIVGAPKSERDYVVGDEMKEDASDLDKNLTRGMHAVNDAFPGKISVTNETTYLKEQDGNQTIDYQSFQTEVQKQVDFLKKAGATHIVFSIDPDVLQLSEYGYTATDYNPVVAALAVGVQDFSIIDREVEKRITREGITPTPENTAKIREEEILLRLKDPVDTDGVSYGETRNIHGYGLSLRAVGTGIDIVKHTAHEQGMEIGVPLPNGGRLLGDVTELSAPDLGGRMARAIDGITTRIANSVHSTN